MANKTVKKIEATKPTLSAQYSTFTRKRKVAAYARVSTAKEEQENSFEAQVSYYTQKIQANPEWVFVEVYSDEGITGTNTKKRDGFNRMMEEKQRKGTQIMANKTVKKIEATKPTLSAQYSTFTRKRKVAAYARVSTAKEEQENSFEAQVSYYTQKIQANPEWVFVEVYSDEGITGTNTKKRDGFNRMIEDALAGKIDLILTKSVSRFARNTVDSLVTIRQLKEKGVEVFFEKENIYTLDAKGELLLTIMSSLAQEEARSISENTSWGRRKSFADGKVSLGYSNFLGYDKGPDGELVINEEQAKIVRRIYSEFLAGKTPGGIAKGLTADGIETPGHKKVWQASTVLNILKNEKYYGAAILQKEITVSYLTKEKRPNTGELPMYYIEKDHEPIVSPETFQMVQEEMRRRREAGSNMQCVSIFSSRIICGDCGGYYGRKIWHSSTKYTAWHWHCNAKFQKRKYCETPTLKEESLEETFVEVFNSLIADKDEIVENYRLCIDAVTDDSEYRRQLGDLNNGCGEVQTLIRSLLMTYSRQDTADDIHEKLKEYEERLDTMARLKQELDLKIAACAAKRVQITGFLNELMKHDAPLAKFDPLVWQAVINYATVNRDCTITFTFRDGTEKTVPIKNGVRPYTKRNKPQEVDGNDG